MGNNSINVFKVHQYNDSKCKYWEKKEIFADDLLEIVKELHHSEEDFEEGDITQRILQFQEYKLVELDLANIDETRYAIKESRVEKIKQQIIENDYCYPPIIYDTYDNDIIDGVHRIRALKLLNQKKVMAFVGIAHAFRLNDEVKQIPLENKTDAQIFSLNADDQFMIWELAANAEHDEYGYSHKKWVSGLENMAKWLLEKYKEDLTPEQIDTLEDYIANN